ncbi:hypothetical protein A7A09_014690 [Paracoccus methylarcula]|uniref:Uncharacterized protein n=1 Tax=Paracoccus methylarcula TaxID=72022 RepID=A0A3R7LNV0_9RHOB|nr:hypothetical protein A7A09_014690 [Paracoccus methylarcula]
MGQRGIQSRAPDRERAGLAARRLDRAAEPDRLPPVILWRTRRKRLFTYGNRRNRAMNSIIYIIGLVVVVLFILSFLGLR